jgi:hypothetical protein
VSHFYHPIIALIVFVMCTVMLRMILRQAKVVKLNVNIDSDLMSSFENDGVNVGANKLLLTVVWRGAKGIPLNWDDTFRNAVIGRVHPPFTAELLGRKVTIVVDGRNDEMERSVIGGEGLTGLKEDVYVHNRQCFSKVKVVLLFGNPKQPMTVGLRDINSDKRRHCQTYLTPSYEVNCSKVSTGAVII